MKTGSLSLLGLIVVFLIVSGTSAVLAQKPILLGVEKTSSSMDKVVTFNGSQFGTNPATLAVRFGAVRADIKLIQDHLLQVYVPAGTTFDNISLTNTVSGLTTYSREQFLLNFQGAPGFDVANLQGQFNFPGTAPAMEGLNDLCLCDFDGDKRSDVAVTNENSGFMMIYPNNSTGPGTISFGTKYAFNTFSRTVHIKCGDLNGDGKPEIVATEGGTGDKVFILRNNSSGPGNFSFSLQSISLTGARLKQIEIADLDLNGKPDIILSSQATNSLRILPNQSTLAAISFGPQIIFTIAGATNTDGLAVEDLNGDHLPEIITAQYQASSNIFLIKNTSTPGTISLELGSTISVGNTIKNIRIGDLDGDNRGDITFTQQAPTPQFGVIRNQSTSSAFTFGAPAYFATDGVPYGQDFGDLDGDGKPDVVLASSTKKSLTILNNKSTNTAISFDVVYKTGLTYLSRHVKIGDMDNDGKPDITFTSVDDNLLLLPASKVSVFRNQSCMVPEVVPEGPLNICNSLAQQLESTKGGGVTYEWTNLTTGISTAGTHLFTPTVTGEYLVTATSEAAACIEQSNIVDVTITAGTAADPLPEYNDPLCLGNTLSFSLGNALGAGYTYNWTGPEGFSATGAAPTRTNARLIDAGEYFLEVIAPGGCVARKQSLIVKVIDRPDFKITYPNSEILCSGQFKKLSVDPASPDYTYEWFETTAGNLGVTGPTFDIGAGGEYYVEASSSTGCGDIQSTKAKIISVISPVPAFDAPETACKGQEVTFTDQSTVDGQAEAFYYWNFGDGNSATDRHGKNIYSSTGVKSVSLTVSYKNNMCARSTVPAKQITITDAPNITIISQSGVFDICPEGSLELSVSGTFDSFLWNTGETSQSIVVTEGGTYDVNVTAPNGCELKSIREITEYPVPVVNVSATPPVIEEGESTQLFAEGLQNYSWEPAQTLNSSTIQDPIAMPLTSMVYLVSGYDVNNCEGKGSVQVTVKGDAIVSKLMPSNFFSPNADAENPYWLVDQIQEYPQCGVAIYDDKGFKVFDAKPYLENWDGTYKGKQLPDGVYYYVIRCDGEEQTPRMGSITILR